MTLTEEQKERLEEILSQWKRCECDICCLQYKQNDFKILLRHIDSLDSRVKELEGDLELALMDERVFRGHYAEQFKKTEALQSRLDRVEEAAKPILKRIETSNKNIKELLDSGVHDDWVVSVRTGDLRKLSEAIRRKV